MNLKTGYKKLRITSSVFLVLVCAVVFCALVIFFFLIKSNKKTDISAEITALNNSIRTHYQKSIDYRGLNTSFALENGIVPAFMSRHNKIFSTLKTEILIGRDASGNTIMPMESFFNIIYLNLDKNKCQSLSTTNFDVSSGLVGISIINDSTYNFTYGGELALPVSSDEAKKYCRSKNTVMFTFE